MTCKIARDKGYIKDESDYVKNTVDVSPGNNDKHIYAAKGGLVLWMNPIIFLILKNSFANDESHHDKYN